MGIRCFVTYKLQCNGCDTYTERTIERPMGAAFPELSMPAGWYKYEFLGLLCPSCCEIAKPLLRGLCKAFVAKKESL